MEDKRDVSSRRRQKLIPSKKKCIFLRKGRINHMILRKELEVEDNIKEKISYAREINTSKEKDLIIKTFVSIEIYMIKHHLKSLRRESKKLETRKKKKIKHYIHIISHYNVRVTEDLFHTSFSSWRDACLPHTCVNYYMNFHKYFFEYFRYNVNGVVHFVEKSSQSLKNCHH